VTEVPMHVTGVAREPFGCALPLGKRQLRQWPGGDERCGAGEQPPACKWFSQL
jgi:hypothetical protein